MPLLHRLTALAAALVVATAACNDATAPTGPAASAGMPALNASSAPKKSSSSHTFDRPLLKCGSATYHKTVQTVGKNGGILVVGKHSLVIPAHALAKSVTITMEAMPDSVVNVRFSPDGLTFPVAKQPTLSMYVKGCSLPAGVTPGIAYVTDSLSVISLLPSTWKSDSAFVNTQLPHFSRYAVHR